MADRLQQLLRQRALLQEHLAWLDREIAEASSGTTPAAPTPVARAAQQPLIIPAPVAPAPAYIAAQAAAVLQRTQSAASPDAEVLPAADEIIEQYRVAPDAMKTDVRKGCFLYFFGALALLALAVVVFYYAHRH